MRIRIIIILVILNFIYFSINAQYSYIGAELGGKLSLTTQTRVVYGANITTISPDNSIGLFFGRNTSKNIRYEFWVNHETISLKYKIDGPIVRDNPELNLTRRYGILNGGFRVGFQIIQNDKLNAYSFWNFGYSNIYHLKYYESSVNEEVNGENFYPNNGARGDTIIPYTVVYSEGRYTIEGSDYPTFNLGTGANLLFSLNSNTSLSLRAGYTLGLFPIMSRIMVGSVQEQIFIITLNDTKVITKGDNISLSVGVIYNL